MAQRAELVKKVHSSLIFFWVCVIFWLVVLELNWNTALPSTFHNIPYYSAGKWAIKWGRNDKNKSPFFLPVQESWCSFPPLKYETSWLKDSENSAIFNYLHWLTLFHFNVQKLCKFQLYRFCEKLAKIKILIYLFYPVFTNELPILTTYFDVWHNFTLFSSWQISHIVKKGQAIEQKQVCMLAKLY